MKIIVTGATGFLGGLLCSRLQADGNELVKLNSKNCDLTQQDSLRNFNIGKYDKIFHLAAWTQAGDFCLYHPGEQWIINQQINTNVLAWWKEYQPHAKLICMGSSCSYDPDFEMSEDNYMAGKPIDSLFTYAMTKRMLYAGLLALNKQFGLKYICFVPSTLYGPGYHTGNRQMHFIFDLIRKIIRGKLYGEPVVLWGDGNQTRELVYAHDFVDIILRLTDTHENDLINIGGGEEFSICYFAKSICEIVGYNADAIQYDTSRYVGAESKYLVVKKLRNLMPNLKLTPLSIGLQKTIDWFWSQKDTFLVK